MSEILGPEKSKGSVDHVNFTTSKVPAKFQQTNGIVPGKTLTESLEQNRHSDLSILNLMSYPTRD